MRRQEFTIVELLVAVAVILIMTLMAVPLGAALFRGNALDYGARVVQSALYSARTQAIGKRKPFSVVLTGKNLVQVWGGLARVSKPVSAGDTLVYISTPSEIPENGGGIRIEAETIHYDTLNRANTRPVTILVENGTEAGASLLDPRLEGCLRGALGTTAAVHTPSSSGPIAWIQLSEFVLSERIEIAGPTPPVTFFFNEQGYRVPDPEGISDVSEVTLRVRNRARSVKVTIDRAGRVSHDYP